MLGRLLTIVRLRGRATMLTPRVMLFMCDAVRRGLTYEDAAEVVCISRRTLSEWLRRGRTEIDGPYRALFEALNLALADQAIDSLAAARKARGSS